VQDTVGGAGDVSAFELGVLVGADASEVSDLFAPESGNPARAAFDNPEADVLGGDLGAARDEEVTNLTAAVHAPEATPARG
jgi:hypothetical protein